MSKNDLIYIYHIRDSINKIHDYSKGLSDTEFKQKTIIQDAVIRHIEIIGEASAKLSEGFKLYYKEIPWKSIIGMRNKMIHDYFGVDIDAVWETVKTDIPILKIQINNIVENSDQQLDFLQ